jgi:4'-phosphopantetheinyl transferase
MAGLPLLRGAVHCWRIPLDLPEPAITRLRETLSWQELRRAAGLRSWRDRRRFVAAHGALRELLGRYLGLAPGRIGFKHGACGRPELARGGRLRFSLSHADGLALVAIAAQAEVGVDVERLRPVPEAGDIADGFFTATEAGALAALPPGRRDAAFLRCWTRKEAWLKARGCGLAGGMNLPLSGEERRWSWLAPALAPGYVGAVAVRGWGWRLIERQWPRGRLLRRSAGAARAAAQTSPRR